MRYKQLSPEDDSTRSGLIRNRNVDAHPAPTYQPLKLMICQKDVIISMYCGAVDHTALALTFSV